MTEHLSGDDEAYLSALLDAMVERRSSVDRAEADVLAMVVDFADACPAETDGCLVDGASAAADETAVVELGARLGMSYRSAANLVTEAVELRDRLPRLWTLVQQGRLQAWKARQVARVTPSLSDAATVFVDTHAAVTGRRNQLPDLRKLVIMAINRCDPDLAEGLEEAARDHRDVTFDYSATTDTTATALLEATLDLLDALDLDATVSHLATQMGGLGDDSPLGVRRAHALSTLAQPQRTLELFGDPVEPTLDAALDLDATDTADTADGTADDAACATNPADSSGGAAAAMASAPDTTATTAGRAPARIADDAVTDLSTTARAATHPSKRPSLPVDRRRRWNSRLGHLYLHLDAADLRALATDGHLPDHQPGTGAGAGAAGGAGGVDLERLGAASLRLVRDWLNRATRVSVRPVLDLTRDDPVDRHDPPEAMRDQIILRDGHCVFPGCRTHARACDLDHIDPFVAVDEGGPPGQTRAANLACLCRRHHRMKTHHSWHYTRTRDGTYDWTDPHGTCYTTAPTPLHSARSQAA